MKAQSMKNLKNTKGFTLAEVIIVVGVIAILVTLLAPTVQQFMKQNDVREEQIKLNQISKAIQAYLASGRTLAATDTILQVSTALNTSGFAPLSELDIRNDVWGSQRVFRLVLENQTFLGSTIQVAYFTIHSRGPNREAEGGVGIPVILRAFALPSNTGWWNNANEFATVQPTSTGVADDMMVRYTNYPEKIAQYKTTLDRIGLLKQALDTYAKQKYAEAIVAGVVNPEQLIYYPRALAPAVSPDPTVRYYAPVMTEMTTYSLGTGVNNGTVNGTRRTAMINLMRMLGLPDETYGNAMATFDHDANAATPPVEVPLFYYSNPRPYLTAATCAARPDPTAQITLPPRVTITTDICG